MRRPTKLLDSLPRRAQRVWGRVGVGWKPGRGAVRGLAVLAFVLGCGAEPVATPVAKEPAAPILPTKAVADKKSGPVESIVPPPPTAVMKEKAKTAMPPEGEETLPPAKSDATVETKPAPKPPTRPDTKEERKPSTPAQASRSAKDAAAITLQTVDLAGYAAAIAQHKGKLVAVDAWATWCVPCVKKFPQFAALAKSHAGGDVVFVSVSVDDVEDKDQALKFLKMHDARFFNLLVTDGLSALQEKLEFEGVPQYFLYDPAGKLVLRAGELEQLAAALEK